MTSPLEPHKKAFSHINGSQSELLDRLAVAELCKGWPVYRDASEWNNFRSLFAQKATVWTTWSGPLSIDDFIQVSKDGKAKGAFIMHRECGTLVELNQSANRAVGKMKATITQRFSLPAQQQGSDARLTPATDNDQTGGNSGKDIEFDVDCDCRFIFFCEKDGTSGEWKAHYVKLDYDKDKVVPADGKTAPDFPAAELARYPEGYKYLGAAQAGLGYKIDLLLPTPRNSFWWKMYACMEQWLDGRDAGLFDWKPEETIAN